MCFPTPRATPNRNQHISSSGKDMGRTYEHVDEVAPSNEQRRADGEVVEP